MATNKTTNRREFISTSLKGGLAITVGLGAATPLLQSFSTDRYTTKPGLGNGFDQQPLPYKYDALENVIDAMTMEIHYSKHAAAYSKNVKEAAAAEKVDISKPLEDVLAKISSYSAKMRNNGGGHYNHTIFWEMMAPGGAKEPGGALAKAIDGAFGSFASFKEQFAKAGATRFGSGWAWLSMDTAGKLSVESTPNQDTPLSSNRTPLLGCDVWEHAYYLKYQNRRPDYMAAWWNVVNWEVVAARYGK